jgi:hypothetical protein
VSPADGRPVAPPVVWVVVLATLLAAALLVSPPHIDSQDFVFHLRAGQMIVDAGWPPQEAPFLFAPGPRRWINPEWLAEVGWFALARLGRAPIIASKYVLVVGSLLLVVMVAHGRGGHPLVAAGLAAATVPAIAMRLQLRPHLIASLVLAAYLLVLFSVTPARRRAGGCSGCRSWGWRGPTSTARSPWAGWWWERRSARAAWRAS